MSSSKKQPTYETNPLRVDVHSVSPDKADTVHRHTIKFPKYAEKPLELPTDLKYIDLDNLDTAISKPNTPETDLKSGLDTRIVYYRLGKGAVEVALYKSPLNEYGELKIVTMGWGGNLEASIARLEAAESTKQNPGTDMLIINNPGSGNSSPIPRSVMKEMKRTGSFMPYGELLAEPVRDLYQYYAQISISGHSMGARTGIALGRYIGPVEYITATDPPGSRKLGLVGLANAFMLKEGAHAREYSKHTDNILSLELQRQNDELANKIKSTWKLGWRGAAQMLLNHTGVMSKDGLKVDLDLLLGSGNLNGGTLQINSPEFSELNHSEDVHAILTNLAQKYPKVDVRQAVLLGQTHSVNTGGNSHTVGALSRIIE